MSRGPRVSVGDCIYHVINRANNRATIFNTDADYLHFEKLLKEAAERYEMRILAYVVMPNHWHLLLYPRHDGDLLVFMQWLTLTHTQQYHARTRSIGYGHLYQGRYKSFVVEDNAYAIAVLKYVERNPVRAGLSERVEGWRWGSGFRRFQPGDSLLAPPPFDLPPGYNSWVNEPDREDDLKGVRISIGKSMPFGSISWTERTVERFGLESTTRERGRPRKGT